LARGPCPARTPAVNDPRDAPAPLETSPIRSEYIYGKRRLREIDRRLRWLHKRLAAAEVVEPSVDRGEIVYFGAIVTLAAPDGDERVVELVGEDEIETELGRISWRSPLGAALMRKREGEKVRFVTPEKPRPEVLEIAEVAYRPQVPDPQPSRWDEHTAAMRQRGQQVPPAAILDLDLPDEEGDD